MDLTVSSLGNEGICIENGRQTVLIDAFFHAAPFLGARPVTPRPARPPDLILVTHDHWDHFDAGAVARAATETGATVVGPQTVIGALRRRLPAARRIEMEPPPRKGKYFPSTTVHVGALEVTAFRTRHSHDHNSYLVRGPGFGVFHDGDNENTLRLNPTVLTPLDAVFICPWQGSGCTRFLDAVQPRHWFLIHLTGQELDEQEAGTFLDGLMDHVPPGLVTLRPGATFTFPSTRGVAP